MRGYDSSDLEKWNSAFIVDSNPSPRSRLSRHIYFSPYALASKSEWVRAKPCFGFGNDPEGKQLGLAQLTFEESPPAPELRETQYFKAVPNFSVHPNHLKRFLKHGLLGPTSQILMPWTSSRIGLFAFLHYPGAADAAGPGTHARELRFRSEEGISSKY